MSDKEWLNGLKVGDRVVVAGRDGMHLRTVLHVTKTQVKVSNGKNLAGATIERAFVRATGRAYGSGSCWNSPSLAKPTEDLLSQIEMKRLERKIRNMLTTFKVEGTLSDLKRMEEILEPYCS